LSRAVFLGRFLKKKKTAKMMSELAPIMAKLDKAYANDKNKLNQEKQKLYKKHGYNMLSGCLPMIVTMTIFFVMFGGLNQCSAYVNLKVYSELSVHYTDTLSAELSKHTEEYKCARAILDNENNKNNIDREYLASVEEYTQKIAYTKASADALNKTADELGDSEDLSAQSAELSEQIDSYNRRLECLALAKKGLEEAYQRWQADLGPVFGNEAGILLGRLTNGRYHDLRVARNFEITLRSEEGTMYHSYNYSGATIDQMYLALRLALVKIISVSESMLPLILDDPFVQYDAIRKQYAYDVIEQFSAENHAQIILTVCRSEAFPESFRVTELQNV